MPVVTDRNQTLDILARLEEANVVMPGFCYDSVMGLEANLHAVKEFAQEYGLVGIAVIGNPPKSKDNCPLSGTIG